MMTQQELHDELWMLTMSILQDSRMDTKEAQILKRWFEEHQRGNEFSLVLDKLNRFLADGYIDRFESKEMIDALGHALACLRKAQ